MKQKGVQPNLPIYNAMLSTAAEEGLWLEALAILDDMLYIGIQPNAMSFNHLLRVSLCLYRRQKPSLSLKGSTLQA